MFRVVVFLAFFVTAVPSPCQENAPLARAYQEASASPESDKSVKAALQWIANHQLPDGGWSFDLAKCPKCRAECSQGGRLTDARIAPTALALWAMFRGRQTPERGDHQQCVATALKFLLDRARKGKDGWSFVEDSAPFDSHALAMIMLCEAYNTGFWELRDMKPTVQQTVSYGLSIQNPDGGWGPQESDLVSTAWYMLALERHHVSGMDIPQDNVKRFVKYIDSIRIEAESGDKLLSRKTDRSRTTAAFRFCQVFSGKAFEAPVMKAIDVLADQGYSRGDMICNLFAGETLILHGTNRLHQDVRWRRWNVNLRDWLVAQQLKEGHEGGSWVPDQSLPEGAAGGRLYSTAITALILETYYVTRWCNCGRGAHRGNPPEEEDFPE
jgi:hypothetical protein